MNKKKIDKILAQLEELDLEELADELREAASDSEDDEFGDEDDDGELGSLLDDDEDSGKEHRKLSKGKDGDLPSESSNRLFFSNLSRRAKELGSDDD